MRLFSWNIVHNIVQNEIQMKFIDKKNKSRQKENKVDSRFLSKSNIYIQESIAKLDT